MRNFTTVFTVLLFGVSSVFAQQPNPIVIGQTAAFTGGPAASVIEITAGARLVIDDLNSRGGVRGRPIKLVSMDDGYQSERAIANVKTLVKDKKAVGLLLSRGTEPTEAMMPTLLALRVPLIGPSTGAMSLRNPVHPYIFNVRASYQGEARKAARQLAAMGFGQIGIIVAKDSFGDDCLVGVLAGLKDNNLEPTFVEKFDRAQKDFTLIAKRVARDQPRALFVIGTNAPVISLIKAMKDAEVKTTVMTLSNNASEGFLKAVRTIQRGSDSPDDASTLPVSNSISVGVAQVFPSERAQHIPIVAELTALSKRAGEALRAGGVSSDPITAAVDKFLEPGRLPSPAMIEGAISAKVLIAGLQRIKGEITPDSLTAALNSGEPIDVGWIDKSTIPYQIRYTPSNHSGIEYIDLSIIGADGKYRR